jgi:tetratricopeptide (TPR) repeat protein/transglutaminase-like putative cysteine protease
MKAHLLAAALLLCLATQTAAIEQPQKLKPPPPTHPHFSNEPYIVEALKSTYRFEADGTGSKTMQTRALVQSESGVQQLGRLIVEYNSDFERLAFSGRVIKPDGTRVEIPAGTIQDLSSPITHIAPLYSDIRQKHGIVPGLRPGDVLEYELRFDQFAAIAPGHFWAEHAFTRTAIVKDETLEIDLPVSKYVNVKAGLEHKSDVRETDGRRIYRWRTANLQRDEDRDKREWWSGTPDEPPEPSVQITTFRDWGEVGDWYSRLESDRRVPDDAIRAKVAEITKEMTDPVEKLRAIYRYVSQEFRYISLSFGIGRYQPHGAAEVFGNRYGDCKDKHSLLAAMAAVAGLQAHAALTSVVGKPDPAFPSPLQFDHVVSHLKVGDESIWLDTTSELAPFRLLAPPVRRKHALVVSAGGRSVMLQIPAEPAVPGSEVTTVEGVLNDAGTLDADVRIAVLGDAALSGRLILRTVPQTEWTEYVQLLFSHTGLAGEISGVDVSALTEVDKPLEYRFHVTKQNYFSRFGKDPKLTLPLATVSLPDPDEMKEGKPVELGRSRVSYSLRLRLPEQFQARLPLSVDLKRDYARYASRYALEGSTLVAGRTMEVDVLELPANRRNDFASFRRTVLADGDQAVTVKVAGNAGIEGPDGAGAEAVLAAAEAAIGQREFRAAAEMIERLLEKQPDHPSAHNDLGLAYLEMGKLEKAETALKRAVELDPFSPFAYNNLGRVHQMRRRYGDAERAFRKQIEIMPLDPWAHRNLGMLLVDRKDYARALPVLEKAVAITPEDPLVHLLLGRAQVNLKMLEKAGESFDRAVGIAPAPPVWNEIASTLAQDGILLDRAQRYAESAVAMTTAYLRNVRFEQLRVEDLMTVVLLAQCWDTLGWVHFRKGSTATALRYLKAAWDLGHDEPVADHLGQVYQRAGKREMAAEYYALAAQEPRADPDSRKRLVALVGEGKAGELIWQQSQRSGLLRSYDMTGPAVTTSAEFLVAVGPGGKVTDARFVSGDHKLKALAPSVKSLRIQMDFPDAGDVRVFRRGILSCTGVQAKPTTLPCALILLRPQDVRSVD